MVGLQARGVKKRCYVLKELVLLCMREELLLTALVCRNMPHRAALVSMRHIRNTCITLTLWLQYEYQSRSGPLRTAALEEGAQLLIRPARHLGLELEVISDYIFHGK